MSEKISKTRMNDIPECVRHNPVSIIRWVPIAEVVANSYNPNTVPKNEMHLLYVSIKQDGYTQPIVTVRDPERKLYVIVDGFHRYSVMKCNPDIYEQNHGLLPIVVLNKPLEDRMASTVRHNRARGKHSIQGMSSLVFQMLNEGCTDADVCNKLGMLVEELVRVKHITGFSKLFESIEYRREWVTRKQLKIKHDKELWKNVPPTATPKRRKVPA